MSPISVQESFELLKKANPKGGRGEPFHTRGDKVFISVKDKSGRVIKLTTDECIEKFLLPDLDRAIKTGNFSYIDK